MKIPYRSVFRRSLSFSLLLTMGLFLILPARCLFGFGAALLIVASAMILLGRKHRLKMLIQPLIFYAIIAGCRFFSSGQYLWQILLLIVVSSAFIFLAWRMKSRNASTALAIVSLIVFLCGGAWIYGFWMPYDSETKYPNGPVVFLGDSLTAGIEDHCDFLYVNQLSKDFRCKLINSGEAGDLTQDALFRLQKDVLDHEPRLVVVLIGGNDILTPLPRPTVEHNLDAIVSRIREAESPVILIEVPGAMIFDPYWGMYYEIARRHGAYLVGESLLRGIFLNATKYTIDGTHLNAAGHALMAKDLDKAMRRFGVK